MKNFTITAEIHARSLVNFYGQYADRHMNLKFKRRVSERERRGNSTICYRKKQIDVSFKCACSVIDNEFRHHIIKVACGSTLLSPRGSTATLTMWWRNLWSITGQTHKKLTSICQLTFSTVFSPTRGMSHVILVRQSYCWVNDLGGKIPAASLLSVWSAGRCSPERFAECCCHKENVQNLSKPSYMYTRKSTKI